MVQFLGSYKGIRTTKQPQTLKNLFKMRAKNYYISKESKRFERTLKNLEKLPKKAV